MPKIKGKRIQITAIVLLTLCLVYSLNVMAGSASIVTSSAAAGALIGTFVPIPGVGTLSGAAIGAAVGWFASFFIEEPGSFPAIFDAFTKFDGGCWFCRIFVYLFAIINDITGALSETLRIYGERTLELGFGFYILFKVLKAVFSFGAIDAKGFLMDLLKPMISCSVAIAILYNMGSFYKGVINPLTALSIGFATEITSAGTRAGLSSFRVLEANGKSRVEKDPCKDGLDSSDIENAFKNAPFGPEVVLAVQCFLKTSSVSMLQYMTLGATFIADSFKLGEFFPLWSMLLIGICLFCATFGVFLAFPFKLVDGMFQLMFVSALMPLWVVLWVLPSTRKYTGTAFKMFTSVLISFICLSVVLIMVLTILNTAMGDLANDDAFWSLMFAGKTKDAIKKIDWSQGSLFITLALTFMALSLSKNSDKFVSQFAEGGVSLGLGSGLQTAALGGAAFMASKVAKPVAKKTASMAGSAIKNTPGALGFVAGRMASSDSGLNPFRKSDLLNMPGIKQIREGWNAGKGEIKAAGQQFNAGYSAGSGGSSQASNGANQASVGADNAASAARDVRDARNNTDRASALARVAAGAKDAAMGAKNAASGASATAEEAKKASEESKKVTEEAKKIVQDLGASPASVLDGILKDPTKLGAIVSAVSGGIVPPQVAAAAVNMTQSTVNEQLAGNKTKESITSKFTDANDQLVREQVESVIRDNAGNIISTTVRNELVNAETSQRAAIEVERDMDGKLMNLIKEVKDENGKLVEKVSIDINGKITDLLKKT